MKKEETKNHIEAVIGRTFEILQGVYENQQENFKDAKTSIGSRILYPKYRNGETRFSEQELKFIFVEQLNVEIKNGWDVFYSVETPTSEKYKFKNEETPKVVSDDEKGGKSARFDLAIHDKNFARIALIEFKANNAPLENHEKDFLKLNSEGADEILTCFFEIVKGCDEGTKKSIAEKKANFEGLFKCWALEKKCEI